MILELRNQPGSPSKPTTVEVPFFHHKTGWTTREQPLLIEPDSISKKYVGHYVVVGTALYKYDPSNMGMCYNTNKLIFKGSQNVATLHSATGTKLGIIDGVFNPITPEKNFTCFSSLSHSKQKQVLKDPTNKGATLPYKLKDYGSRLYRTQEKFSKVKTHPKMPILQLWKILKTRSVGYELETSNAPIYYPQITEYGWVPLRDGSLPGSGREFASLPINNSHQMQSIFDGVEILRKKCQVSTRCAFHVHIGNTPKDKEFVVSLYILYQRLQAEILGMMPLYLRDPVTVENKAKNYAQLLPRLNIMRQGIMEDGAIDSAFEKIFNLFIGTNRKVTEYGTKISNPWGRNSWSSATRYVQLNIVNLLLNPEGTIEFRVHPPTINPQKIFFWTVLCAMIVDYAATHTVKILNSGFNREKILLMDVIDPWKFDKVTAPLAEVVMDYCNFLTDLRMQQDIEASTYGNMSGGLSAKYSQYRRQIRTELDEDANYVFDVEYEI